MNCSGLKTGASRGTRPIARPRAPSCGRAGLHRLRCAGRLAGGPPGPEPPHAVPAHPGTDLRHPLRGEMPKGRGRKPLPHRRPRTGLRRHDRILTQNAGASRAQQDPGRPRRSTRPERPVTTSRKALQAIPGIHESEVRALLSSTPSSSSRKPPQSRAPSSGASPWFSKDQTPLHTEDFLLQDGVKGPAIRRRVSSRRLWTMSYSAACFSPFHRPLGKRGRGNFLWLTKKGIAECSQTSTKGGSGPGCLYMNNPMTTKFSWVCPLAETR